MYFVQCPRCGSPVEIPPDAVGPERTDPYNVVGCLDCGLSFDFDDEDVQIAPDLKGVF